jgi:CRP-like cAMP-binding protein
MTQFSASFEIDLGHLLSLGVVEPDSSKILSIFASGQLSSNERLYFSLWGSKLLSATSFEAQKKIFQKGEDIIAAYFIVSGNLLAIDGQHIERLGPGSVLFLAESLAGLPAPKTVVTVTPVQARIIPLHKVDHMVPNLPDAIRQIIRTTVKRTLGLKALPKGVL